MHLGGNRNPVMQIPCFSQEMFGCWTIWYYHVQVYFLLGYETPLYCNGMLIEIDEGVDKK